MDELKHDQQLVLPEEPELYLEPPRMTARDSLGVVAALLALAVIGYAGYVWLNPELDWSNTAGWQQREAQVVVIADAEVETDAAGAAADAAERERCPYCGMYTDISPTEITASFSDNSHSHFDAWDCVFNHELESELELTGALARDYLQPDAPVWLPAEQSWYLYDTIELEGSMPPYVAAFETEAAALMAQPELGGELVDFAALRKKWQ